MYLSLVEDEGLVLAGPGSVADPVLHLRARFCPLCGDPLQATPIEERLRPRCQGCGFVYFWNPATGVAAVVRDGSRVLLIRRKLEPHKGQWALPAGYQEIDEDPRDTARREVREETGLAVSVGALFDAVWVPDDPRKPANVLVYLCEPCGGTLQAGSDAAEVAWFELDHLPAEVGFGNREGILERLPRQGG